MREEAENKERNLKSELPCDEMGRNVKGASLGEALGAWV